MSPRKNYRFSGDKKPEFTIFKPAYPDSLTVWFEINGQKSVDVFPSKHCDSGFLSQRIRSQIQLRNFDRSRSK